MAVLMTGVISARPALGQDARPIENLRIPLEHYEDGTIKRQLHAREARMRADGPVIATGVRIECFDATGELAMVVTADNCTYDRESGDATSTGRMRAQEGDMVISGKGFTWTSADETFRIHSEARVAFSKASNLLELGKKK